MSSVDSDQILLETCPGIIEIFSSFIVYVKASAKATTLREPFLTVFCNLF